MKQTAAVLAAVLFWGCASSDTERLVRDDGLSRSQAEAVQAVKEFSISEIRDAARASGRPLAEFVRIAEIEGPTLTHAVRRAYCGNLFDSGENFYSVVRTDSWEVGGVPVWSTPVRVRSQLGEPESVSREQIPWTDAFGVMRYVSRSDTAWFSTFRDSLAYPTEYPLSFGALTTDRGTFRDGTSESEIAASFPESYRCRNWPLGASLYLRPYDTEVFVDDTSDTGGRLVLWLREGQLRAVGVYDHWASMDERTPSRRSD